MSDLIHNLTTAIEKIVKKFGSAPLTKQNPENPAHALTFALNDNGAKIFICKVEKIQEDSLDSIPSLSTSVKIQIIVRKVYLRKGRHRRGARAQAR